jgi:hypothetical protein
MRMRKTLAILATVATVGATAVTAPAEARGRGIGPGLAAGALAAGAAGAYGYYGPGYVITMTAPVTTGRPITVTDMGLTPITADPIIGTTTGAIAGDEKARKHRFRAFLMRSPKLSRARRHREEQLVRRSSTSEGRSDEAIQSAA